jgi:hypothetical protein
MGTIFRMWRFPQWLAVVMTVLIRVLPSLAGESILPPTYQPGREYVLRSTQHAETVAGFSGEAKARQVADVELEVRSVCREREGEPRLRDVAVELLAMKIKVRLGSVEMRYDSRETESGKTVLGQTFRPLIGKSFSVTLDEAGEVVETAGMEAFSTGDNLLAQQFGPEQLKQIATPALRLGVPTRGAVLGESWKQDREIELGPGQRLTAAFDVRYARDELLENRAHGVIEYGAGIDADLQTAPGGEKVPGMTIRIRKGRVNGAISIDKELRFPRSGMSMTTLTMTLPNPSKPAETIEIPVRQSMDFELLSTRRLGKFERP